MMHGPHALKSSKVNEILRNDTTDFDRSVFLVAVEVVLDRLPPSAKAPFVQLMVVEQAAREVGLPSSEVPVSAIDDETGTRLKAVAIELAELLAAAGLMVQ